MNSLRIGGSPLPRQGEGESEGSSQTKQHGRFANPSPQSSPLLRGERRERPRWPWSGSVGSARSSKRRFHLATNLWAARFWIAALLLAAKTASASTNVLPIYIEDNHAGTFYWLAQNIDLDQPHTLILFDAHSDASGIFDSDKIRDALRTVASAEDRGTLLERWRNHGRAFRA